MKNSLVLSVVLFLSACPAMAVCNVPQPRLVCAQYYASSVVVEATLTKITTIGDDAAFDYQLHANRLIRGQMAGNFRVYEENSSGRATFEWKPGRVYLLFLFYSSPDRAWELDGCGNSGPVNAATAVLQQIETIQMSRGGGVIHGNIRTSSPSVAVSGVTVDARGLGGVYRIATGENGTFEILVPVGR
jgi:hypothetical protein